jgi:hypothetical protein
MQMVLHHELFAIEPKDIREPVEARWKAFRFERKMPQQDAEPLQRAPRVYGLWSIVGSPWQAITLLVPLLAILGVLVDALIRGAL